jgi:very-short-patch-repair endonuclease
MLVKFKKALRLNQTEAEEILWYRLRNRNLNGFKFRRQYVLYGYIVDFVCLREKLIIELDGGQHAERKIYDKKRSKLLEANGFRIIRFWNNELLSNIECVLETIYDALTIKYPSPDASRRPLPQGER